MYIKSKNVLIENELKPQTIHFSNGKIKEILAYETPADRDYGDSYIVPGFIDLHMHGGYGVDVLESSEESFDSLRKKLLEEGTTSFLATSTTLEKPALEETLGRLGNKIEAQIPSGAECIGIHLEGPFLNPDFAGAQKRSDILQPEVSIFDELQQASKNYIKRITFAPEMDQGGVLLAHLVEQGVLVSMGHSGATLKEAQVAIDGGVRLVTHMFNGMLPFHHREIGIVGATMLSDDVSCEFIADGIHVSFEVIELIKKVKGTSGIILVTDSNKAKGLPPGDYTFHNRNIVVNEHGEARIKETGSLAGSTAKMNDLVRNVIHHTSIDKVEAFRMASLYPAKLLDIDDRKGQIKIDHDADVVVLDEQYHVVDTFILGKEGRE